MRCEQNRGETSIFNFSGQDGGWEIGLAMAGFLVFWEKVVGFINNAVVYFSEGENWGQ